MLMVSYSPNYSYDILYCLIRGRHGREVVGFTTTYAISDYHHWYSEFESRSWPVVQHLYNNIVLSMLYAEICPKVRRHNGSCIMPSNLGTYSMDNTILLLLLWMSLVILKN